MVPVRIPRRPLRRYWNLMRAVKLTIVLPAVFCGIDAALWCLSAQSKWANATDAVCVGLSFPAMFPAGLLAGLSWAFKLSDAVSLKIFRLSFLLCVAGLWYWIGYWLDHRMLPGYRLKRPALVWYPSLALGFLALCGSFVIRAANQIIPSDRTLETVLLQTWAVFLIGIPVLGIKRRYDQPYEYP